VGGAPTPRCYPLCTAARCDVSPTGLCAYSGLTAKQEEAALRFWRRTFGEDAPVDQEWLLAFRRQLEIAYPHEVGVGVDVRTDPLSTPPSMVRRVLSKFTRRTR
jgi:hypothetical protein